MRHKVEITMDEKIFMQSKTIILLLIVGGIVLYGLWSGQMNLTDALALLGINLAVGNLRTNHSAGKQIRWSSKKDAE